MLLILEGEDSLESSPFFWIQYTSHFLITSLPKKLKQRSFRTQLLKKIMRVRQFLVRCFQKKMFEK
ncbi:hypothetical protein D9O36_03965 [Zobellia amurskyensis]|uniref:Uncharacterized protein n=1 Tax=Zobellia amurskyensis TaxID=248905 RepID=A0A7X3D124_9FLAO|nr:hypothetical protein [Zobellia amurskyensis]